MSPRCDAGDLGAVEAARERLGHGRDLGRDTGRNREEVPASDALGDEEELGVGAVEQREELLAERLLAPRARRADPARRRVRRDEPPAGRDVDPADLVPERARRWVEEDGMPAPVRLEVGAVRQGDLDLEHDVTGARHRVGHLVEPQVARRVQPKRPHGVKTTLNASRRRQSSSPSAKRSSGSTVGSGTSRSSRSAAASAMYGGAAERVPSTVSSRR